jgi:hypothetical protein
MYALSAGAIAAFRKMLLEKLDRLTDDSKNNPIPPSVSRELTNAMLDIIEYQIDRKLVSRQLMEPQS